MSVLCVQSVMLSQESKAVSRWDNKAVSSNLKECKAVVNDALSEMSNMCAYV